MAINRTSINIFILDLLKTTPCNICLIEMVVSSREAKVGRNINVQKNSKLDWSCTDVPPFFENAFLLYNWMNRWTKKTGLNRCPRKEASYPFWCDVLKFSTNPQKIITQAYHRKIIRSTIDSIARLQDAN